ncbi:hypothetical protein FS749_010665 [Ceratobasidium sp. UAMH 11750]|nr:hypothetical protein FS749_010665 [Ceratobasidium sp. UAMH 11750]
MEARLISWCRLNPEANNIRKEYRRLGRRIFAIPTPEPEFNLYPSVNCEIWAEDLLVLLDDLVTFKPNYQVTRARIFAVCMTDRPEYGAFHIRLMQLRDATARSNQDHALQPLVPRFPKDDCFYDQTAFGVAAVIYRDEIERFIAWLYLNLPEQHVNTPPPSSRGSPVGSEVNMVPLAEELRNATRSMGEDITMVMPGAFNLPLTPPRIAPRSVLSDVTYGHRIPDSPELAD